MHEAPADIKARWANSTRVEKYPALKSLEVQNFKERFKKVFRHFHPELCFLVVSGISKSFLTLLSFPSNTDVRAPESSSICPYVDVITEWLQCEACMIPWGSMVCPKRVRQSIAPLSDQKCLPKNTVYNPSKKDWIAPSFSLVHICFCSCQSNQHD